MAQTMKAPTAHAAKITLRPLHDRVLVKRLEEQDEKHGSIIIPDSAKEKPQEGKVIAVGNGQGDRGRQEAPPRRQGGRSHPLRQVLRQRGQARRRGATSS